VRRPSDTCISEKPMTDNADPEPGAKPGTRPPRRITVGAVVRAAGSTAALVAIYYLLLLTRTAAWAAVTMLAAGLVALPHRDGRLQ